MSIACAVVMDPINAINTAKDSTFAMLLEAQRRSHGLHYIKPRSLSVRNGQAWALMANSPTAGKTGLSSMNSRPDP